MEGKTNSSGGLAAVFFFFLLLYSQKEKFQNYIAIIIRPKFKKPIARFLNMVQVSNQKYRGMLLELFLFHI
jgi:hypothetical protein